MYIGVAVVRILGECCIKPEKNLVYGHLTDPIFGAGLKIFNRISKVQKYLDMNHTSCSYDR